MIFDKLLEKLELHGIDTSWISNYLDGHTQQVQVTTVADPGFGQGRGQPVKEGPQALAGPLDCCEKYFCRRFNGFG